jgi:subtilisin family serine protease
MPDRILKVYASGPERDELLAQLRPLATYDAFVVIEVSEADAARISAAHVVEDITGEYDIRLADRVIDTSLPRVDAAGTRHAHPAYRATRAPAPGAHHHLVQFVGPIKAAWLAGVRRAGGVPRASAGGFTWIVRATDATARKLSALPYVRWVGHLPHRARIAPRLLARTGLADVSPGARAPRRHTLPDAYVLEFFGRKEAAAGRTALRRMGLEVLEANAAAGMLVVRGPESPRRLRATLDALSAIHGVRLVRERTMSRPSNDVAAGIMGAAPVLATPGLGLGGRGEVVAICDTGLDSGDAATIHPDFAGRIAALRSYPITSDFDRYVRNPGGDDGPADLDSGHGTHVCGSVAGSGASSGSLEGTAGPIRGLAHEARIVFQAVEQRMEWKDPAMEERNGRFALAGIPLDLSVLLRDAYARRARVHSNSWGGGDPGAYDAHCEQLDRFVFEHPDLVVVVAAGNDGTDRDRNGSIELGSVSSPGTAKNCITVGASENLRPGFAAQTYGEWWPEDYPTPAWRTDAMADRPDEVAAFSSRGPTLDGRVKPDVVAPGTFILSTRSTRIAANNQAWAAFPRSRLYFHMGGTSMATPLVAGAAAVVRQFLRTRRGVKRPSAALVKAALVAGARRLPGYAPAGAQVDPHQGFGRIDLAAILAPPAPVRAELLDRPGLRTGEQHFEAITVASSAARLRVVLAYSDAPGPRLVNNLNLVLRGPDGSVWLGNQPAGSRTFDARNNVEVVQVDRPAAGAWRVEVVASNVPAGPQPYALALLRAST